MSAHSRNIRFGTMRNVLIWKNEIASLFWSLVFLFQNKKRKKERLKKTSWKDGVDIFLDGCVHLLITSTFNVYVHTGNTAYTIRIQIWTMTKTISPISNYGSMHPTHRLFEFAKCIAIDRSFRFLTIETSTMWTNERTYSFIRSDNPFHKYAFYTFIV